MFHTKIMPIVALLACTAWAGSAALTSYDYVTINQNMQSAVSSVLPEYSNLVSDFSVAIDPNGTNFDEDMFTEVINASLVKAPWNDKSATTTAKLSVKVRPEGQPGYEISLVKKTQTDALAAIKYLIKMASCPTDTKVYGAQKVMMDEDCAVRDQILNASNLQDLRAVLQTHIAASKSALQKYLGSLTAFKRLAPHVAVDAWLAAEEAKVQEYLRAIDSVRISDTEGGFSMSFGAFSCSDLIEVKSIKVELTETSCNLAAVVHFKKGDQLYDAVKPEFGRLLKALESNESYSGEVVKAHTRIFLNLAGQFLTKKN